MTAGAAAVPASTDPAAVPRITLSVFLRAVAILAVTTGIVAALVSWQAARLTARVAGEGLARYAAEVTESLAVASGPAIRFRKVDDVLAEAALVLDRSQGAAAVILAFDGAGAPVAVLPEGADAAALLPLAAAALSARDGQTSADGHKVARLALGKDGVPVGGIAIAWSDDALQAAIRAETAAIRLQALGVFLALTVLAAWVLRAGIALPLRRVAAAMDGVAAGDHGSAIPHTDRRDEVGALARNLDRFRADLGHAEELRQAAARDQEDQARVVADLSTALGCLAAGDLSTRLDRAFPPAYEGLRADLNRLAQALSAALADVVAGADRIRHGSEGLTRSTDELSHRTETQAATLEQSVAAIEELTGAVRAAVGDMRRVAEGVGRARAHAADSQQVVRDAVQAMSAIRASSDQITRIIGVIDDISFQTNLLALNAGVEAARAGEAGRGFSVVASEVRALAQRTSESAQQIRDLIRTAADGVLHGVELVDRTGEALRRIAAEVEDVTGLSERLATGIGGQSAGLNEVAIGLGQLDRVTQQNAGMVDQTAATQRRIGDEAQRLAALVARFRLAAAAPGIPAAAALPAAAAAQPDYRRAS